MKGSSSELKNRLVGFGLIAVGFVSMATGAARVPAAYSACIYQSVKTSVVHSLRAGNMGASEFAVASPLAEVQAKVMEAQARSIVLKAQARMLKAQARQIRCPREHMGKMVRLRTEHVSSLGEVL